MENLIKYMLNYAFDHGISYALLDQIDPDYPSVSFTDIGRMVINLNWKRQNEIPFMIGHEIGHFANGDKGTFYYINLSTPVEHQADLFSLNLIYKYASKQFYTFDEPGPFMQQFAIPYRLEGATYKLFQKNNDLIF